MLLNSFKTQVQTVSPTSMSINHGFESKRQQLCFAVKGLSAHDELLLKSMIRLLNFRTKHDWRYDASRADVLIVDQHQDLGVPAQNADKTNHLFKIIELDTLRIDVSSHDDSGQRHPRRLNSVKVEAVLNILGDACWRQKHLPQDEAVSVVIAESASISFESSKFAAPIKLAGKVELYRVNRWPHASMLQNASRKRMAAVLVGLPVTLANMVEKTGVDSGECADFIVELRQAGLLTATLDDTAMAVERVDPVISATALLITPNTAAKKPASIFARIRNRLSSFVIKSP